jgi:translation initiation factor IF-2
LQQQKDKVRIFALARELGMESKDLLNLCRENGIDVKNQLSTIEPEVRDAVVALVKRQGNAATGTAAPSSATPVVPQVVKPIRNLDSRAAPRVITPTLPPATPKPPAPQPPAVTPAPVVERPAPAPVTPPAVTPPVAPTVPETPAARVEPPAPRPEPVSKTPPTVPPAPKPVVSERTPTPPTVRPEPAPTPPAPRPEQATPPQDGGGSRPVTPPAQPPAAQPPSAEPPRTPTAPLPHVGQRPLRDLSSPRRDAPRPQPQRPRPAGASFRGPTPPPPLKKQQQQQPRQEEKKPTGPRKLAEIPTDLLPTGGGQVKIEDIHRAISQQRQAPGTTTPEVAPEEESEEDRKGKGGRPGRATGAVIGRDERHKARNLRQQQRKKEGGANDLRGRGTGVLVTDEDVSNLKRLKRIKKHHPITQPRKGKVPIELPITVRSLSEAVGVPAKEVISRLMAQGVMVTINATLDPDVGEAIALDLGCELDIKRQYNVEDDVLAGARRPDNPEELVPRAPIVTIMGHVDHGKTSLLDRIRKSNVVATEAGGITQVIRAWRVEHNGKPITFLDTPGHEAFTKMRARGAHVTDIAVIVVAADDGVMPQTEEAIAHAKAAGVSIVVAINKVDLPNANLRKTEQQLYGLGLIPDNMGGDVPFVQTSAATGKGIDELLENLSVVAELKELKANPNRPAVGTCLEANLTEGEGVNATLLVQNGTLHRGDVILCGASYGRVRAMYDDLGRPIAEAGPSVPVRITGLDEVPNADDPFVVVEDEDLAAAREISENRKSRRQEAAQARREPLRIENLTEQKIAELKVILKADFRGSIEAIRKELEKLHHEEVRVRILHAAIGGITESDVQLALTSPQDTLILGFNVVPDDRARALAEERGIQIRQYDIIYKLTDDVRSALEGKLKPREEVIHLGRAVVRETFKISRVGTIAGCYVTSGTIERSAKVRVIRGGVVIYPPADRTAGLESLKRFKEDVREVREGFECGIKIAGYDDIKVDDVIEAYRIEQVQRTLS